MVKPTFLQTLLGRPSQTYSFPREKEYHSTKRDLLRNIAAVDDVVDGHSGEFSSIRAEQQRIEEEQGHGLHFPLPLPLPDTLDNDNDNDGDDDDSDVFYTPNTTPRLSMLTTSSNGSSSPYHPNPPLTVPSTSTTSLSSTIAASSESASAPTLFSISSTHSDSTRVTTPVNSDLGHDSSVPKRRSSMVDTTQRHNRAHTRNLSLPSPDPGWSKEVRWLIPPSDSPAPKSATTSTPPKSKRHSFSDAPSRKQGLYGGVPNQPSTHKKLSKSIAKGTPSIMTSMAALLEEDEDHEREISVNGLQGASRRTHSLVQHSRSSVIVIDPRPRVLSSPSGRQARGDPNSNTNFTPRRSSSTSSRSRASSHNPRRQNSAPAPSAYESTATSRSRTRSRSPSRRRSIPPLTPYSPALPSHGTPGYTSLTLPRAPPPASLSLSLAASGSRVALNGANGRVDLTRSGIAQTTMASVEVVKGLGAKRTGSWGVGMGMGWVRRGLLERRRTVSGGEFDERRSGDGGGQLGRSVSDLKDEAPLGFTGHREPPGYVCAGSVLVQVWAVGVDGVDEKLVSGKGKEKVEVGFIPGRSFIGRVLECGWEVKEEDVKKGEWVIGLLDVKKCGVLAEFIVVDRHRIHRVPHPRMQPSAAPADPSSVNSRPNSLVRSSTIPRSRRSTSTTRSHANVNKSLTLEEFSLLPLCGLPAYRAVRTFVLGLEGKSAPEKHGRALVLRGHDGAGGVAVQMLVRRGWRVCVHVPMLCAAEDERKYMRDVEDRVREWGAEEVVFDDGAEGAVVRVIEGLIEDSEVFDVVLDTVGGRDIWEAGERLLRGRRCGLFTTLVGDMPERAIPSAGDHFRAGLRSLMLGNRGRKRSVNAGEWKEKDEGKMRGKGKVGYAWVSVAQDVDWEGEDVKESLRAVLGMALESGVRPWTGRVVPFERTPEVFARDGREHLRDGGTVVVKIVG